MASSSGLPAISTAAADLGLGSSLGQQVQDETEEQRKKRMSDIAQRNALGSTGSLAVTSLFGPMGTSGAGY